MTQNFIKCKIVIYKKTLFRKTINLTIFITEEKIAINVNIVMNYFLNFGRSIHYDITKYLYKYHAYNISLKLCGHVIYVILVTNSINPFNSSLKALQHHRLLIVEVFPSHPRRGPDRLAVCTWAGLATA